MLWPNRWMDQDATWYRGRSRARPRPHVLDGDPPPKGHNPQFLAHVCCSQSAGWIKMPLGTEADLGPGDIVLDGDPAPLKRAQHSLLFGPCLLWPNGRPSQLLLSTCSF